MSLENKGVFNLAIHENKTFIQFEKNKYEIVNV